jgi:carbohydrate-binding DOMON domain-containing protein
VVNIREVQYINTDLVSDKVQPKVASIKSFSVADLIRRKDEKLWSIPFLRIEFYKMRNRSIMTSTVTATPTEICFTMVLAENVINFSESASLLYLQIKSLRSFTLV